MRKLLLAAFICMATGFGAKAQICDPNGNLIIFSNYDGGVLNINVDVNIPNIKIGVVSYEAVQVNVTGAFAANVTNVVYAGFNATNNHCGFSTPTTINSTGSVNVINVMPQSTLSNVYGNNLIICNTSCVNNVNQGGCNTPDQIEAYFLSVFNGSSIRFHKTQYGCWSGSQLMSAGGNCCGSITSLTAQATSTAPTCSGGCNGVVNASAIGGVPPYSYQWTGGPATAQWTGRCAGTYLVTVTDGNNATDTQSVTVTQPAPLSSTMSDTACMTYTFNGNNITQSGVYYDTLAGTGGCDSIITLNLTIGTGVNLTVTQNAGTLTSAQAGAQYQWIRCPNNTLIPGATAQSYTPTQSGNYAVIVTRLGCSDTSACTNVIPTGINSISSTSEFIVYPNPARGEVNVETALTGDYRITDQLGRVVLHGALTGSKTVISLQGLSSGLYFLSVNNAQPVKLLKQ